MLLRDVSMRLPNSMLSADHMNRTMFGASSFKRLEEMLEATRKGSLDKKD